MVSGKSKPPRGLTWLKNFGVTRLRYITHRKNLGSILELGILCRKEVERRGLKHTEIAHPDVKDRRREFYSYVPLFFADNTPMLYRTIEKYGNDIVLLEVHAKIMIRRKGVLFSDGNVANNSTHTYSNIADLEKLDWSIIWSLEPAYSTEWKRIRAAEVLVPKYIRPADITSIHVQSEAAREYRYCKRKVREFQLNIPVKKDLTIEGIVWL